MEAIRSALELFARSGFDLRRWLAETWFGIALWQYVVAFVLITLTLFARRLAALCLNRLIVPWLNRAGSAHTGSVVGALVPPFTAFVGLFGLFLTVKVLLLPGALGARPGVLSGALINQSFQVAGAAIVIWALMRLIDVLAQVLRAHAEQHELPLDVPVVALLRKSLKLFVGIVGGLLIIQHLGYPIASLLGGLGIGGLAIALAAQDTLANVFGSIIIFTDKPFKVGDWVRIGEVEGFVETIGFRSTRIRTWPKALVTIPNKSISNSEIENWSAMPIRRVSYTLTVTYDTSPKKVEALVRGIERIITEHPGVDQGFSLVSFSGFGQNGLEVLVYYFTRSTAWKEHMRVRQEVNLAIMRLLEQLGVSVAVPSRRVSLSRSANELRVIDGLSADAATAERTAGSEGRGEGSRRAESN
ncbi:MAG TPA: mechanosensitive ion channel family protein [Limnochordia bacterium]